MSKDKLRIPTYSWNVLNGYVTIQAPNAPKAKNEFSSSISSFSNVQQFIDHLKELSGKLQIPLEDMNFETYIINDSWDDSYLNIIATRLETDEEYDLRIKENKEFINRKKYEKEKEELILYEKLKAKFKNK